MSEAFDPVFEALDEFMPAFDTSRRDWRDVLERAGINSGHRRRRPRLFLAITGVPALAAVAVVVSVFAFSSSPSVIDNALAALGTKPVTHIVLEDNVGTYLLNLHTGARTPASGRIESWYRASIGLYAQRTFRGIPVDSFFTPARLMGNGAGLSDVFGINYREQLQAHRFRVVGSGKVGGTPVYWIESTPFLLGDPSQREVERIAISKATYKPLYSKRLLNGHAEQGSGVRILTIETTDRAPANLHRQPEHHAQGYAELSGYPPLTLRQAHALRPALTIRSRIAGLPLALVAQPPTAATLSQSRFPGAALYYGTLLNTGLPNDKEPDLTGLKPYVSVTAYTSPNALTHSLRAFFLPDGRAVIDPTDVDYSHSSATFRTHGLYVVIHGSNDALVLAAAREIAH